jgi:hypothetical protein
VLILTTVSIQNHKLAIAVHGWIGCTIFTIFILFAAFLSCLLALLSSALRFLICIPPCRCPAAQRSGRTSNRPPRTCFQLTAHHDIDIWGTGRAGRRMETCWHGPP